MAWSFLHVDIMASFETKKPLSQKRIESVISVFRKNYKEIPLEIFSSPYQILVATMLSSRTKDEITLKAAKRLFQIAPNLKKLQQMQITEIKKMIYPVGFYKTKAKQLKFLAAIINKKYKDIPPNKLQKLTELPGVGRKTANLFLNRAYDIPTIAVDTHVHRISNLLGWVKTKTPEATEKELTKILPRKYWKDINRLFVSIGRQHRSEKKLLLFLKANKII